MLRVSADRMALTTEGSNCSDSPSSFAGIDLIARGVVLFEEEPCVLWETGVISLLWPRKDDESLRGVLEAEDPMDGVFNELSEEECDMTLLFGAMRLFSALFVARPKGLPS